MTQEAKKMPQTISVISERKRIARPGDTDRGLESQKPGGPKIK